MKVLGLSRWKWRESKVNQFKLHLVSVRSLARRKEMFSWRWGDWEKGRDGRDKKLGAYYRVNVPVRHSSNDVRETVR